MDRREVPRKGVLAKIRHQRTPTGADLFKLSRMPDKYTVTSRVIAPMSGVEPALDDPLIRRPIEKATDRAQDRCKLSSRAVTVR
jgi:hypothetical protein